MILSISALMAASSREVNFRQQSKFHGAAGGSHTYGPEAAQRDLCIYPPLGNLRRRLWKGKFRDPNSPNIPYSPGQAIIVRNSPIYEQSGWLSRYVRSLSEVTRREVFESGIVLTNRVTSIQPFEECPVLGVESTLICGPRPKAGSFKRRSISYMQPPIRGVESFRGEGVACTSGRKAGPITGAPLGTVHFGIKWG